MKLIQILLLCFTQTVCAQNNKTTIQNRLMDSAAIKNGKLAVLLESSSYKVITPFDTLTSNLYAWTNSHPTIDEDKKLLAMLAADTTTAVSYVNKMSKHNHLEYRLNYRIGDLLTSGKCFVYSKKEKRRINSIKIVEYGSFQLGHEGTKYLIKSFVLLNNIETIY